MQYLINNTDVFAANGIEVIKATGLLNGAAQRISKRVWEDKSGVDVDFNNIRLKEQDYTFECICLADSKQALVDKMLAFNAVFSPGLVVLSLRGDYRAGMLVFKEEEITGKYSRASGGQYAFLFNLKLTDSNPAATRWITYGSGDVVNTITYAGTEPAYIFWGDGARELLPGPGDYTHQYASAGEVDIIIDADGETTLGYPYTLDPTDGLSFTANDDFTFAVDAVKYGAFGHPTYGNAIDSKWQIIRDGVVLLETNASVLNYSQAFTVNEPTVFELRLWALYNYNGATFWLSKDPFNETHTVNLVNAGITTYRHGKFPPYPAYGTAHLNLSGNALSQASVDELLLSSEIVASDNGYLNISGGTNAVPNASGISAINTLISKGWEVYYNAS